MRTAIAVTTGFFASVAETAYMRTTHIVDMDRSAGRAAGQLVTPSSLAEFGARYLNAARLGKERIEQWSLSARPGDAAPSSCDGCSYRPECHLTFGQIDGYGLYPFTEQALWIGAGRADQSLPASLNPRVLQNNLLVEVLDTFAPTIEAGEYPPQRMLEKLGGVKNLTLASENLLKGRDAREAGRWTALLELYDGTGAIVNPPAPLCEAFSVPEIPDTATRCKLQRRYLLQASADSDPVGEPRRRSDRELDSRRRPRPDRRRSTARSALPRDPRGAGLGHAWARPNQLRRSDWPAVPADEHQLRPTDDQGGELSTGQA